MIKEQFQLNQIELIKFKINELYHWLIEINNDISLKQNNLPRELLEKFKNLTEQLLNNLDNSLLGVYNELQELKTVINRELYPTLP